VGHSGHQLGGNCDRTEDLFLSPPDAQKTGGTETANLHGSARLPGFNHPLYPDGDPRAEFLLNLARQLAGDKALQDIQRTIDDAKAGSGQLPSIELGLVAVARALKLPRRGASALWAVGRSIGWVAHVIEQRLAGSVIRPRAQ